MTEIDTLRLAVDADALDTAESLQSLRKAAAILKAGGTVAFPTETVYGLGANALDEAAVRRIFEAKQRPSWDPLIVHVANADQLGLVVDEIPAKARLLMEAFWPGPLTLLLPKSHRVPPVVTAGRPRVGVRMPAHPVAKRLIELAGLPLAAPSANSFGRTSPTRAAFVLEDLDGRIDALVDAGETRCGLESSVVDACEDPPVLYRTGMVTFEQLREICGTLTRYQGSAARELIPESSPSPGVALRHYAPRARLILFQLTCAETERIAAVARELQARGEVCGIMLPDSPIAAALERLDRIYRWGKWADVEELARRLFAGMRELDSSGATVIFCPLPNQEGIAEAIRDRLLRAAR